MSEGVNTQLQDLGLDKITRLATLLCVCVCVCVGGGGGGGGWYCA